MAKKPNKNYAIYDGNNRDSGFKFGIIKKWTKNDDRNKLFRMTQSFLANNKLALSLSPDKRISKSRNKKKIIINSPKKIIYKNVYTHSIVLEKPYAALYMIKPYPVWFYDL